MTTTIRVLNIMTVTWKNRFKIKNKLTKVFLSLAIVPLLIFSILVSLSHYKAYVITKPLIDNKNEFGTVINISKWVSKEFKKSNYRPWIYRYLFLASHRLLPEIIRLERGTFDIFYPEGACNNSNDLLNFLLSKAGYAAKQHNMISPSRGGHSATSVLIGKKWIFVDTYNGIALGNEKKLLSLEEVKNQLNIDENYKKFIIPLIEQYDDSYYNHLSSLDHASEGEQLIYNINLPEIMDGLKIGVINDSSEDVTEGIAKLKMGSYLHYVGPKHDREFLFRFIKPKSLLTKRYKITFLLTELIDTSHVPSANIEAQIDGKTLSYAIPINKPYLDLSYKEMKWNLSRIINQRSWYIVDAIQLSIID